MGVNIFPSLFTHQFSKDVLLLHAPCEILGTNKRQHVDRYTPGYGSGKRVFQYHVNVYEIIVHMLCVLLGLHQTRHVPEGTSGGTSSVNDERRCCVPSLRPKDRIRNSGYLRLRQ